jgi:sugar (pentulose or hexulose) kinase
MIRRKQCRLRLNFYAPCSTRDRRDEREDGTDVLIYAVDLGTTNIKVALYDERLQLLALCSEPVEYTGTPPITEFDPERLYARVIELIRRSAAISGVATAGEPATIALTGQAESLVLVDGAGRPVCPGISWLDERSTAEAEEITARFGVDQAFAVTGQPLATSTWPATKLRWLLHHKPELLETAELVLMLKDYVQLRLTGHAAGELSTRAFTYLFDVRRADYWDEMLCFCEVRRDQLPELVLPGTELGPVLPSVAADLPTATRWSVNVGALDHFASMVGTGSYRLNIVSESAGTVLSLSALLDGWDFDPTMRASFHRGVLGDDFVLFDCCDSGAVCLDWFARAIQPGVEIAELDASLDLRQFGAAAPLFLPQITGVNPPDFLPNARAAFIDLTLATDGTDLAYAVMEGVAHLLRSNVEYCERAVGPIRTMVSNGGGTASRFWTQLKADVCNVQIDVPKEREATCRGAAVLGLISAGVLGGLADAGTQAAVETETFEPRHTPVHDTRYARYLDALHDLYG